MRYEDAMADQDFLSEIIEESTARNPEFPELVAAAERRRKLLRELVEHRKQRGLTQTVVAARMGTSQSAVAKLEGQDDAKESMIDRYAAAIGVAVERRVVDAREPTAA
jgi:DNA-binding transcriptional regulator YiaG